MDDKKIKLIGIGGSNGSGKDTIAKVLQERFGWVFYSTSDALREEAKKRGITVERENLREISRQWREAHGLGILVDKAVEKYHIERGEADDGGVVVGSLRNGGESARVQDIGGVVIWVDADPQVRYKRITSNKREGRSEEDDKTYEEFLAEEEAEMTNPDPAALSSSDVRDAADFTFANDGDSLDDFMDEVEEFLKQKLNLT